MKVRLSTSFSLVIRRSKKDIAKRLTFDNPSEKILNIRSRKSEISSAEALNHNAAALRRLTSRSEPYAYRYINFLIREQSEKRSKWRSWNGL